MILISAGIYSPLLYITDYPDLRTAQIAILENPPQKSSPKILQSCLKPTKPITRESSFQKLKKFIKPLVIKRSTSVKNVVNAKNVWESPILVRSKNSVSSVMEKPAFASKMG